MTNLRELIDGAEPVLAPLVLNPLMARMAEAAGFQALYLGGGATGYAKAVLEANLNVSEMVQAGNDIRTVSDLPLILDAAAGWGDPMHMHRTIPMVEAAGFAAIEIEDQILPKRAHHHIGIEHMIPLELMAAKVREAVAARRGDELVIIARTNGVRSSDIDDGIRRIEAYREAGADMLLISPRNPEEVRYIGERVAPPLVQIVPAGGLPALGMTVEEMGGLGFRLLIDPVMPLLAAYRAWRECYGAMRDGMSDSELPPEEARGLQQEIHRTIGFDRLIDIEKATVER